LRNETFKPAKQSFAKQHSPTCPCWSADGAQALKPILATRNEEFSATCFDEHLVRDDPAASSKPHPWAAMPNFYDYSAATGKRRSTEA